MTSYVTPKKGAAFRFFVSLTDQGDTNVFKANPTLASGDVKVCKDGGAIANITTLPSAISSSAILQVDLSATEMDADNVTLIFIDAAGSQWCDLLINIQTAARTFDEGVKIADGVAHGGSTATLRLGSSSATPALNITNSGGDAVQATASGSNGNGLCVTGEGSGSGMVASGGLTGYGIYGVGAQGIRAQGSTSHGLAGVATGAGSGIYGVSVGGTNVSGVDEAGIRTAVGLAAANLDTKFATIWTTALAEAYRSTGATGTAAQLLYEILQNITEFSLDSTLKTVKKLDGSTTAKTYTLNSATTPTSITETT